MLAQEERPIANSYWVEPGRLLAGRYAGAEGEEQTPEKMRRFLRAGVSLFVNLTEEGELDPYESVLQSEASALGRVVEHHRMPIKDMNTPTPAEMVQILDTVETALSTGHTVYVHCWGGKG
ncbi:MAG: protein-tyrosine phosphatase family protein, partial [Ardenticatenaceae bacterium]